MHAALEDCSKAFQRARSAIRRAAPLRREASAVVEHLDLLRRKLDRASEELRILRSRWDEADPYGRGRASDE